MQSQLTGEVLQSGKSWWARGYREEGVGLKVPGQEEIDSLLLDSHPKALRLLTQMCWQHAEPADRIGVAKWQAMVGALALGSRFRFLGSRLRHFGFWLPDSPKALRTLTQLCRQFAEPTDRRVLQICKS